MVFDNKLFEELLQLALTDERLRIAKDLRNKSSDKSQRILNALQPGTTLPIHRHSSTSETIIVLKGCLEEFFYDDNGDIIERYVLSANTDLCGMQIPAGQWHSIIVKEPSITLEVKDGEYIPIECKDILSIKSQV